MKRIMFLFCSACLTFVPITACGTADINEINNRGQIYDVNTPGDSPLINNPEYNDPNNNIFGPDRDDLFINDEDINITPNTINRGDSPLRNDQEKNDPDNSILDADKDDAFIDDEDINMTPNERR